MNVTGQNPTGVRGSTATNVHSAGIVRRCTRPRIPSISIRAKVALADEPRRVANSSPFSLPSCCFHRHRRQRLAPKGESPRIEGATGGRLPVALDYSLGSRSPRRKGGSPTFPRFHCRGCSHKGRRLFRRLVTIGCLIAVVRSAEEEYDYEEESAAPITPAPARSNSARLGGLLSPRGRTSVGRKTPSATTVSFK